MLRLAIFLLFFQSTAYSYVFEFGYNVAQTDVDLRVHHFFYDQAKVEDYIIANMAGKESSEQRSKKATEIAYLIKKVADHFQVDPLIYLSLIRMESAFYYTNNLSNSGAVGLTQFVQIGLKEVFSQLGFLSDSNAPRKSIEFFQEAYEGMRKEIKSKFSLISFSELKAVLKSYNLSTKSELKSFKSLFKNDTPLQVIFGAVFLKTLVGRQCDRLGRSYCRDRSIHSSLSFKNKLLSFYRKALIAYNGEKKPISFCSHEGKILSIEKNFMRFCYAAKIEKWAEDLNEKMQKNFESFQKELNYIYIPRILDQFFILNEFTNQTAYHKRVKKHESLKLKSYSMIESCDDFNLKMPYFMKANSIDPARGVLKQSRNYLIPRCISKGSSFEIESQKVDVELNFNINTKVLTNIVLKNANEVFSYGVEPKDNLEIHFLPRLKDFLKKDIFMSIDYVNILDSTIDVSKLSSGNFVFKVKVEGLDPVSFDSVYFQAILDYDSKNQKFINFRSLESEF